LIGDLSGPEPLFTSAIDISIFIFIGLAQNVPTPNYKSRQRGELQRKLGKNCHTPKCVGARPAIQAVISAEHSFPIMH